MASSFEGVDDVGGPDGLSLGVLHEDERVLDDSLEPSQEDVPGAWVDPGGDSSDAASPGESPDVTFGDLADELWSGFALAGVLDSLWAGVSLSLDLLAGLSRGLTSFGSCGGHDLDIY